MNNEIVLLTEIGVHESNKLLNKKNFLNVIHSKRKNKQVLKAIKHIILKDDGIYCLVFNNIYNFLKEYGQNSKYFSIEPETDGTQVFTYKDEDIDLYVRTRNPQNIFTIKFVVNNDEFVHNDIMYTSRDVFSYDEWGLFLYCMEQIYNGIKDIYYQNLPNRIYKK